jgi:archaellum component FlaC
MAERGHYEGSSHLSKVIDQITARMDVIEERIKMLDVALDRHTGFSMAEATRFDTLRQEISSTHEAIAKLTEQVNGLSKSIDSVKKAPVVFVGLMASLAAMGSALIGIWKFVSDNR